MQQFAHEHLLSLLFELIVQTVLRLPDFESVVALGMAMTLWPHVRAQSPQSLVFRWVLETGSDQVVSSRWKIGVRLHVQSSQRFVEIKMARSNRVMLVCNVLRVLADGGPLGQFEVRLDVDLLVRYRVHASAIH